MNMKHLRLATLSLVALGAVSSVAQAQARYAGASNAYASPSEPYGADDRQAVLQDRAGHFSCGYNEVHTRLERKDCGGVHSRY